jgi:hypothetical protein
MNQFQLSCVSRFRQDNHVNISALELIFHIMHTNRKYNDTILQKLASGTA